MTDGNATHIAEQVAEAGNDVLGIPGLTPGGAGVWVGVLMALIAAISGATRWWIIGMPERKRAANEAIAAETKAMDSLVAHLTEEVKRLGIMVSDLSSQVVGLQHELAKAEAVIIRMKAANDALGEARQVAANIVAADRVADRRLK